MIYSLIKLQFLAPVHFGGSATARSLETGGFTCCADTLFSSLCHTALRAGGEGEVQALCAAASSRGLLLSDLLPYREDTLYLPRPFWRAPGPQGGPAPTGNDKKALKRMTHLPCGALADYLAGRGLSDLAAGEAGRGFGQAYTCDKVAIRGLEEPMPYPVGLFSFEKDCGLYLAAATRDGETLGRLLRLLRLLGVGGIGGKTSAGYGSFEIAEKIPSGQGGDGSAPPGGGQTDGSPTGDAALLFSMLQSSGAARYVSITTALPRDDELDRAMEGSFYQLARRSGFLAPARGGDAAPKKREQYFFAAGSVFRQPFEGGLYGVAPGWEHPVLRYSMPLFLGVMP